MAKSLTKASDGPDMTAERPAEATEVSGVLGTLRHTGHNAARARVSDVGIAIWAWLWDRREMIALLALLLGTLFLAFFNLESNPRTWHDEGGALSLARTLAEDGVYANRNAGGYQAFGFVQSVGPTVILPIALVFKLFGAGLLQGRVVMAAYVLFVVAIFYLAGRALFGWHVALLAAVLLLGTPAARLLYYGRQGLGEVPAFGLFLAGWLIWARSISGGRVALSLLAGALIGAAMVTKLHYLPIGIATLSLLAVANWRFYRQQHIRSIAIIGLVALACVAAWWGWQLLSFGSGTFGENAAKLRVLSAGTAGFDLQTSAQAMKFLLGAESGHFFSFWGFPALAYAALICLRRDRERFALAGLLIFTAISFGYWFFWIIPWSCYALAPVAVSALFVAKLFADIAGRFTCSWQSLSTEWRARTPGGATLALAVYAGLGLLVGYPLQSTIRTDVIAQDRTPQQVAAYLNASISRNAVIETWERELGILTGHTYHFPDQSLLSQANTLSFQRSSQEYLLGADYFRAQRPAYIVVGWFARWSRLYDPDFLATHAHLLASIGDGEMRYDVYQLQLPY